MEPVAPSRSPARPRWFRLARRANLAAAIVLACLNVGMLNLLAARYPARFHWSDSPAAAVMPMAQG